MTETATVGDRSDVARWLSVVLGGWLFVSTFLWPHSRPAETNTWMLGMLIATFAVLAAAVPSLRRLNSLAAVWLFVATLVTAHDDPATLLNNGLVAIAVFSLSLVGPSSLHEGVPRRYVDVW
jgi:hypothetical protein